MSVSVDLLARLSLPLGVVLAGFAIAYAGYRELEPEIRRHREDPVPVREAATADGPIELRGVVQPEAGVMEAPFTGTDCVAYEFEVEEYVSSGKSSHWDTLASGHQHVPFRLVDDTGSILVEPDGGDLTLTSGWETEIGAEETAGGRIREFLRALDVEPGEGSEFSVGPISVGTGDRRRYSEQRLDVGESVSVFGRPECDPDAGGDWGSDEVDAALRAGGSEPFVIADSPTIPTVRRATLSGAGVVAFGCFMVLAGVWSVLELVATAL